MDFKSEKVDSNRVELALAFLVLVLVYMALTHWLSISQVDSRACVESCEDVLYQIKLHCCGKIMIIWCHFD